MALKHAMHPRGLAAHPDLGNWLVEGHRNKQMRKTEAQGGKEEREVCNDDKIKTDFLSLFLSVSL